MCEPIVSIATIQRMALRDFVAGKQPEECPLPWHSAAWETYQLEFSRLANTTPPSQRGGSARGRIEQAQGSACA